MKKFSIFKTFDVFFRVFIIFLICFVWCRYFVSNLFLSLFLTIILTTLIEVAYRFFMKAKNKKNNFKTEQAEQIEEYINSFVFLENSYAVNFFYNLSKINHSATKKSNYIIIQNEHSKIILFPYFLYRDLNVDDLISIYNKAKKEIPTRIIICTNKIENNAIKLSHKLQIETFILDGIQTYEKLIKKYNYFPIKTKLKSLPKITFKDLCSYALNKKRTKGYLITSILLLFSSFIVPYKIYYVVMSSLLLIFSLISFTNPKYNKIDTVELLDVS